MSCHRQRSLQGFVRTTTKYWVKASDVSQVKYHISQHLPIFQFNPDPGERHQPDSQLINSVYLDNSFYELYHGRLDKRPGAIAMRIRWCAGLRPCVPSGLWLHVLLIAAWLARRLVARSCATCPLVHTTVVA